MFRRLILSALTITFALSPASSASANADESAPSEPSKTTDSAVTPSVAAIDGPSAPAPAGAAGSETRVTTAEADEQPPSNASADEETSAQAPAEPVEAPTDGSSGKVANTAVLGAAAPTPPPVPFQAFFTLGLQMGTGTFISGANRDDVGYTLGLVGLYRLLDLLDGRLDVFTSLAADQSLTTSSAEEPGSVAPREFFFRDVRLGLLGRSLLNSKSTGLIVGSNLSFDLPTSEQSQAQGRIVRINLSGNLARLFSDVGPGSLLVRFSTVLRQDIDDGTLANAPVNGICNSRSVDGAGECLSNRTGFVFGVTPSLALTYFIGDFNIGVSIAFINTWQLSSADSDVPDQLEAGEQAEVGRSPNAVDSTYNLVTSTNISVTYTLNQHVLFTLGLATAQGPVDKCNQDIDDVDNDTGQCVTFPFFDFNSPTNNLSSVYFNTTLMY